MGVGRNGLDRNTQSDQQNVLLVVYEKNASTAKWSDNHRYMVVIRPALFTPEGNLLPWKGRQGDVPG